MRRGVMRQARSGCGRKRKTGKIMVIGLAVRSWSIHTLAYVLGLLLLRLGPMLVVSSVGNLVHIVVGYAHTAGRITSYQLCLSMDPFWDGPAMGMTTFPGPGCAEMADVPWSASISGCTSQGSSMTPYISIGV